MRGRKKKKIETSKLLLIVSDVMAAVVLLSSIVAVFILQNTEPLVYLIPAVFGLSATSHGFGEPQQVGAGRKNRQRGGS